MAQAVQLEVTLIDYPKGGLETLDLAASKCYRSTINPAWPVGTLAGKCADSGHTSILEHGMLVWKVEGVSRALLGQLTRHRHASFSVESQRYGSQNYGLDYEDSDYDTKAIVIPTFENYVYSKTRISTVLITPENEHIDVKDIRTMFDNLAKSNINFLEILFTKFRILNPRYSELLAPIFQRREEIATYDMQGMLNAACGMSMQS